MPTITKIMPLPDGTVGVALDICETEEGSVSIWLPDELEKFRQRCYREERLECQIIAVEYGGADAEEIAELIGSRGVK